MSPEHPAAVPGSPRQQLLRLLIEHGGSLLDLAQRQPTDAALSQSAREIRRLYDASTLSDADVQRLLPLLSARLESQPFAPTQPVTPTPVTPTPVTPTPVAPTPVAPTPVAPTPVVAPEWLRERAPALSPAVAPVEDELDELEMAFAALGSAERGATELRLEPIEPAAGSWPTVESEGEQAAVDEEATLMSAERALADDDPLGALTAALKLNIRVREGRGKRDDLIVRRQDEILFDANLALARAHLAQGRSGASAATHRLMGLLHLYAAQDGRRLASQNAIRSEVYTMVGSLIVSQRLGQTMLRTSLFGRMPVPAPDDDGTKAELWSRLADDETDPQLEELYRLQAYAYDLTYIRYQLQLAAFYLGQRRYDEADRYLRFPLPVLGDEGARFFVRFRDSHPEACSQTLSRKLATDSAHLTALLSAGRLTEFVETITDWRDRLLAMTVDVPFEGGSLVAAYLRRLGELLRRLTTQQPNHLATSLLIQYRENPLRHKAALAADHLRVVLDSLRPMGTSTQARLDPATDPALRSAFTSTVEAVDRWYGLAATVAPARRPDADTASRLNTARASVQQAASLLSGTFTRLSMPLAGPLDLLPRAGESV